MPVSCSDMKLLYVMEHFLIDSQAKASLVNWFSSAARTPQEIITSNETRRKDVISLCYPFRF